MIPELKIKLLLWEVKSNQKRTGKELFEELRYEMQFEQQSFRNFLSELEQLGYIKISGPNKTDFGNVSLTIKGEQYLSFSEEERLDIILNYCKDMVSSGDYNVAKWNKIADRTSEGNNPNFRARVDYIEEQKFIEKRDKIGYVATPKGLMFEGFVAQKIKNNPNEKAKNTFEFAEVGVFMACPFTHQQVNAKAEEDSLEYHLAYNDHHYTIKLANIAWGHDNLINESNDWIFQGMLFNNEWPIEPETIITKQLIERIVSIRKYPEDFEKKWQYFLTQCFIKGGKEYIPISYDKKKYQCAYATDDNELERIKSGLISKGFIKNQNDIELTEEGRAYVNRLLIEQDKSVNYYKAQRPKALIVATEKDKFYADKLVEFLHKNNISIASYGLIKDEGHGSAFNLRESLLNDAHDYVIFIKSSSSDKNNTFGSAFDNAALIHRSTERRKFRYIFLAVVDDADIFTRPFFIDYNNAAFDFRVLSSRQSLVEEIELDWAKRFAEIPNEPGPQKRVFDFPKITLNIADEFWLSLIYKNFLAGKEPPYTSFITEYLGKDIPSDYDPLKVKNYLLVNGSQITFYGIWVLDPTSIYIDKLEQLIKTVQNILTKPISKDSISYEAIKAEMELSLDEGLKCLDLLNRIGGFMNGMSSSPDSFSITIGGYEQILREYVKFESLEKTLKERFPELVKFADEVITSSEKVESTVDYNNIHAFRTIYSFSDNNFDPVMGVVELSDDLAKLIDTLPEEKGQIIGIFGKWGRGKSFFIKELLNALKRNNRKEYINITYHAWKYQETPSSWAYLYELLAKNYLDKKKYFFGGFKYWRRLVALNIERHGHWPIIKFVISLVVTIIGTVGVIKWNLLFLLPIPIISFVYSVYSAFKGLYKEYSVKATDIIKKYSSRHTYKDALGLQADIQEEIIKLLKVWIREKDFKKKKILLIVEDIDRCTEDKIIQNIDALRVMLEDEEIYNRLIAITAVDERILKNAIRIKYSPMLKKIQDKNTHVDIDALTSEYLDKIFISAIKLGVLSESQKEEFFEKLADRDLEENTKSEIKNLSKQIKIKNELRKISSEPPDDKTLNYFSNDKSFDERTMISNEQQSIIEQMGGTIDTGGVAVSYPIVRPEDLSIKDSKGNLISFNDLKEKYENRLGIQDKQSKLTSAEYFNLLELMKNWEDATPRKMKIFYYRYLLSKNLLYNKYIKKRNVNFWQNEEGLKVLMNLIMHYTLLNHPEKISEDKKEIQKSSESDVLIPGASGSHKITKTNCLNVLESLEFVIAY